MSSRQSSSTHSSSTQAISTQAVPAQAAPAQAVFTQGPILRHVLVMSGTGAIGLMSLFVVDLLNMYFLSLLDDPEIVAAVGFSSALLFLLFSMCIGIQIAMGALVARAEGSLNRELAGRYCTNVWIFSGSIVAVLAVMVWFLLPTLLQLLGARDQVLVHALSYSHIMLPSILLVAFSMCGGAAMRAIGDARRSMYCILAGGFVNAILDPVFIFGFGWGIEGAAIASVLSRFTVFAMTMQALFFHHRLPRKTSFAYFKEDLAKIATVALPAMMTNLMTPLGAAFVLTLVAVYGADAVAAYAVLGRIVPVIFAGIFSLSGAIGPIVGQNAGAQNFDRVAETLVKSAWVIAAYVAVAWLLMYLLVPMIIHVFNIQGDGVLVFEIYSAYLVGMFFFAGLLFIANAAFNNLHRAHWSMAFNIGRTFLGTIPLAWLLSQEFGLQGLLFGDVSGAFVFGCLAFALALGLVSRLKKQSRQAAL